MNKLEKAKEVIKNNIKDETFGIFDSRNLIRDIMDNIYDESGLTIDICFHYGYFEVFGLDDDEFNQLVDYYEKDVIDNWIHENTITERTA